MRASRNSRCRWRRGALGAALACLPFAAGAQPVGPPIQLVPPAAAPEEPTPSHPPVASEELAAPAPDWAGDVAPPDGTLPRDFWNGTPRALAEVLLMHQPDTTSPALQSLQRRLLLSPGAAPEGPDAPGLSLPGLRAAALLRLGEVGAARAVVAAMPEGQRGRALPLVVDAEAIAGDVGRACGIVRERIHRDQNLAWQRALIACQALTGKLEEARLGLQLLAEQGAPRDEALAVAVDALSGLSAPATVEHLQRLDPLAVRLLVAAHRGPALGMIDTLPAGAVLTLALDSAARAPARLTAAARAARLGALSVDRLRGLYTELADAADATLGSAHEARDFVAIARAATAAERLARAVAFCDHAGKSGAGWWPLAARLVAPLLREIEPDPSLAGSAPAAARLLLGAGDVTAARRWATLVSGADGERLRFLLQLVEPGSAAGAAGTPLAVALEAALGRRFAAADWLRLPPAMWNAAAATAPPAAWLDLAAAADAKRVGETVLAAVLVAAPSGNLSGDPIALHAAVLALRRVGLDADARRVALEAALAAGL